MEKKFKLPKEFGEKWLTALRSGEYEQGTGRLYRQSNQTFCCLGVAGAVCNISIPVLEKHLYFTNAEAFKVIPEELASDNDISDICMGMNDLDRKSFLEIADWIEENVEFYD